MQIFARITKVDEATRRVTGIAASEAIDHAKEALDYDLSKQYFTDWSTGIAKATDGKSVGNLRVMHGNVVAGKLVEMTCDDVSKAFPITAEVTDDNEWRKVLAGCYTGFSIGGSYVSKAPKDAAGVVKYVAKPNEVSLVDLPCNPDATFTVSKADGAQELRKFETTTDNTEALAKWFAGLSEGERETLAKIATAPPETVVVNDETPTGDLSKSATSPEEDAMNAELQKNHDLAKADLAKAQDDLAKAIGERDELKKALDTAATEIATRDELLVKAAAALDERMAIIEKFQNAPAPVKAALMAIAKGDDLVTEVKEVDKVKKSDGTVDEAATAIKKALMNPVITR